MELLNVTLSGIKSGTIWNGGKATKDFKQTFFAGQNWNGLKDALLSLTKDGDFQDCKISELYGQAEYNCAPYRYMTILLKLNPLAMAYKEYLTEDCNL
jgi:hypothetical protein